MAEVYDISYAFKTRSYRTRLQRGRGANTASLASPGELDTAAHASRPRWQHSPMGGQYRAIDCDLTCRGCLRQLRTGEHAWLWWDRYAQAKVHCGECFQNGRFS